MKIQEMDAQAQLAVLATLINEANYSMECRDGLRAGLFIRRAKTLMDLCGIQPARIDDFDLESGEVWTAEEA